MRRITILTLSMATLIAALYGWQALATAPIVQAAAPAADPIERDRLIAVFEERVSVPDPEPLNLSVLGRLYLARGRSQQNLADYTLARDALLLAAGAMRDSDTLLSLADSHLALHEFAEARAIASQLVDAEATDAALATLADAEVALGGYANALHALERLDQRHPGEPSVLVRRAQYHFLTGDIDKARDLAERAADVAVSADLPRKDQSFYMTIAGRMNFEAGHYRTARNYLQLATEADALSPGAFYELGRVRAAEGNLPEAIRLVEAAVALLPEPTTLAYLGDLYIANADESAAAAQYETVEAIARLDQRAYRLAVAAALAASDRDPGFALELATAELMVRPDPTAWHIYAVALYETGELDEAYTAVQNALGPADARLWYHAGVIAGATGRHQEAIDHLTAALHLNREFHPLDAARARALLEELNS